MPYSEIQWPREDTDKTGAQVFGNPQSTDTVRKMVFRKGGADIEFVNSMYCEALTVTQLHQLLTTVKADFRFTLECNDADFGATVIDGNTEWKDFFVNTSHVSFVSFCIDVIRLSCFSYASLVNSKNLLLPIYFHH